MNLNDIKDQLSERWNDFATRIKENETVVSLTERFQNLSPLVQKLLMAGFVLFVGYMIYSVPASFVDSAKQYEDTFLTNRRLLRDLFRSARNPQISPDRFVGPDFNQMKAQVEGFLTSSQILETQKGAFAPANRPLPSKVVPSAIRQAGMSFELKKLNLKQVVALSEQISSMHPNTKLASVDVKADTEDPHYFNVTYTLSSLSLPMKSQDSGSKPKPFKAK